MRIRVLIGGLTIMRWRPRESMGYIAPTHLQFSLSELGLHSGIGERPRSRAGDRGDVNRGRRRRADRRRPQVERPYGQAVGEPPLLSAPVLSPVPQITNVPAAVVVYLYDVPEPPQPAGRRGDEFRNGPPIWFCALVCWVSSTDGRAPF